MAKTGVWFFLFVAVVAANLPWLTSRIFFLFAPKAGEKKIFWRLLEWLVLYFVTLAIGFGIERASMGDVQRQGWEFYAVTLSLFAVLAIPSFIYRYNLRRMLARP
ncbi:MAG: DUF2818 family protein [Pseudomonadota bacterium]|uniref:DUF2818 family protein n=1 Tax=Thermithiobacillus tepidarius TaxID=929 RepID=UPI0003FE3405|nr:DUF2818 family protein [Thermithiobacillus tepidarius]